MSPHPPVVAIVDDDVALLHALGRLLAVYGYRAELFSSPREYLAAAASSAAVCALIDVELGAGMDGLELGRAILATGSAMPLVFMTGSCDADMRLRALELDCAAFLEKPFHAEDLVAAIEGACASGRGRLLS